MTRQRAAPRRRRRVCATRVSSYDAVAVILPASTMPHTPPPQTWLWTTDAEFYGDDDVTPDLLRPGAHDGYWKCAKQTRRGDLALLWRTSPKCDIGYLLCAESDAFPLHKDRFARSRGWRFGCDYRVLHRFQRPLTIGDLKADPWLAKNWGALQRGGLQGSARTIPGHVWAHLSRLLRRREGSALARALRHAASRMPRLLREQHIEQQLMREPRKLRDIAANLALWESDGRIGRQVVCDVSGGRMDLLFTTPGERTFVVVELKAVRATSATFGQVCSYMGWVKRTLAKGRRVLGVVVAVDSDANFVDCLRTNRDVKFRSLADLGYAD